MRKYLKVVSILASLLFFICCASHTFDQKTFDKAYRNGNYEKCIAMLFEHGVYDKDSQPLKNMDIATLAHYMKDYKKSQSHFKACTDMMEAGDLRSIAQFESFYLNILNSLNYYNQGNLEGALVEIKNADHVKVNQGKSANNSYWYIYASNEQDLQKIRSFSEDEKDSDEYKATLSKMGIPPAKLSKGTPRKPTTDDLYRSSPTAYYLGALFRDASGDTEGARFDRDVLKTLNPTFNIASKEGSKALLNVIAFSGRIAQKSEVVYYYPPEVNGVPIYMQDVSVLSEDGEVLNLTGMRYKFAYAKAGENETKVNRVVTIAKNIETGEELEFNCDFLEDFGDELKKNVALKARREFNKNKLKSIVGKTAIAITYMLAVAFAEATASKAESIVAKILAQSAVVAAIASYKASLDAFDKGIKADTRQARFLPARSYAGGMNLTAGKYNIKVQYKNRNTLIQEEEFANVNVSASSLNLLESICLK